LEEVNEAADAVINRIAPNMRVSWRAGADIRIRGRICVSIFFNEMRQFFKTKNSLHKHVAREYHVFHPTRFFIRLKICSLIKILQVF